MTAAMAAADAGASVLHLEKMPRIGGIWGYLGGTAAGAQTRMQLEAGLLGDSSYLYFADCMREEKARKYCDPEVLMYFCQHAGAAVDWLDAAGAFEGTDRRPIAGVKGETWSVPRAYPLVARPLLAAVRPEYQKRLDKGSIVLRTGTRVTRLLVSAGRVAGLAARTAEAREINYGARAIVICTGGFAGSMAMVRKYNHPNATDVILGAPAFDKGEGLVMCEEAGALLVNLGHAVVAGPTAGGVPDPTHPGKQIAYVSPNRHRGIIWLDATGRRVINEDCGSTSARLRDALNGAPGQTLTLVFDSKVRAEREPLFTSRHNLTPARSWEWFDEKAQEGVIIKRTSTLEALATALGMNAATVKETVAAYNLAVEVGQDGQFNRRELDWKIQSPPFYGIKTGCAVVNSSGGPATNVRQQVLDTTGRVIPGLYAAGEVAGYQACGTAMFNIGNIVFGRQAGRMAALEAKQLRWRRERS